MIQICFCSVCLLKNLPILFELQKGFAKIKDLEELQNIEKCPLDEGKKSLLDLMFVDAVEIVERVRQIDARKLPVKASEMDAASTILQELMEEEEEEIYFDACVSIEDKEKNEHDEEEEEEGEEAGKPTTSSAVQNPLNKFKCQYNGCSNECQKRKCLDRHIKEFHKASTQCPFCGYSFSTLSCLTGHLSKKVCM